MVVFAQKWLSSCKVVLIGQSGCKRATWFYSGKVVVFGQQLLYSGKLVVFVHFCCIRTVVLFAEKLLYSGKVVVIGQNLLFSGKSGCFKA